MHPVEPSETRYAKTIDGVHVAYQVAGQGPVDLVVVASVLGLGGIWQGRRARQFFRRLASFSRLILFDRRGSGQSDHVLDRMQQLSLENRMEDVRAVMDAVGSPRAVLLALDTNGFQVAAMFAVTHPDRTAGLVAYGASARELWAPENPSGIMPEEYDAEIAEVERGWGTGAGARVGQRPLSGDARRSARHRGDPFHDVLGRWTR
jgi:pimeloyl-ACP methyl ester carboxylesterase